MTHPVDARVGRQLRLRRKALGFSQTDVGDRIDLTYQQIQKYENGSNRMSASRLFDLARVLDVPVSWFFAGLEREGRAEPAGVELSEDALVTAALLERIPDAVARQRIRALIKVLAKNGEE